MDIDRAAVTGMRMSLLLALAEFRRQRGEPQALIVSRAAEAQLVSELAAGDPLASQLMERPPTFGGVALRLDYDSSAPWAVLVDSDGKRMILEPVAQNAVALK
jgi:hypothetical protein